MGSITPHPSQNKFGAQFLRCLCVLQFQQVWCLLLLMTSGGHPVSQGSTHAASCIPRCAQAPPKTRWLFVCRDHPGNACPSRVNLESKAEEDMLLAAMREACLAMVGACLAVVGAWRATDASIAAEAR
eukprot:226267-Rhodomonas_salina.3